MEGAPPAEDSTHESPNREAEPLGAATVGPSQPPPVGMSTGLADELRGMFQTLLQRVDTMQNDHNALKEYVMNRSASSSPRRRPVPQEGPAVEPPPNRHPTGPGTTC